ncbi:hypothetical protein M231_05213 [Tremella mesenterica]|uniref:Uncharacterized protein n=1 Tax=Tremella mesenterica TaxID=5217 RepID=A0A4Q1BIT0_TREME|nr:hypothetical protein M231_05213 [Tremella mesenterica]
MMTNADHNFPSLLDAILHYYPINSVRKPSPPLAELAARASSLPLPSPLDPNAPRFSRFLSYNQPIHAPIPRHASQTAFKPANMDPSPGSPNKPRQVRASPSPSRHPHHHGLSALSPLQMFSPLESNQPPMPKPKSRAPSETSSGGPRRPTSVTPSLSRRQSVISQAAKWGQREYDIGREEPYSIGEVFSRLTIVKAPAEKDTGLRQRSKSSSSLNPFTALSVTSDGPATANRPRRSFAASSFAGFSPISATTPRSPLSPAPHYGGFGFGDAVNRIMVAGDEPQSEIQHKTLSPEKVLEIARGLEAPIAIPEGGLKRADLKRRKSANKRNQSHTAPQSPEIEPLALEPVEYLQMDEDTLLPFVDRPREVNELLIHTSNERTFALLRAAFPKHEAREKWRDIPPTEWCWDEFVLHLTTVDRFEYPDYAWVFKARQAVRQHSIALWEKLGSILGCDPNLLNAGGEDGAPESWGGLGLGDEGEFDPTENQVLIEGLSAIEFNEFIKAERAFVEGFGPVVEDEGQQAAAGMTALLGGMETIGEGDEDATAAKHGLTTAQRAAKKAAIDPMSPYAESSPILGPKPAAKHIRSRSSVGLQIMNAPQPALLGSPDLSPQTPYMRPTQIYERGPGSPLFPSSFSSLSAEPNLGRSASVGVGGAKPMKSGEDFARVGRRIVRKPSGAGLSESAITFASESDYAHSAAGHD